MSTIDSRYTINGLINTANDGLSNLEQLANAAGCWITYDTHEGKFAVVMNAPGTSQYSFTNDNIIGPITIAATPLDKLYNTVKVSYPHEDLKGKTDWVQVSIPQGDRLATEFDNVLMLDYGIVTNPVQAQLLGFIELKQSRVDKVVTFKTDFSKMGVKAGDLIDITNDIYSWTAKMFRVISVAEADADDGSIEISITALEYDPTVYDEDLTRYVRSDSSGIIPLSSLSAPTKPIVTPVEGVVNPHVTVSTSIIDGLVTEIEFWSSTDVTLDDASRSYSLLQTYVPSTTIPLNTAVSIDVSSVSASTFVVKARAKNSDGVSVFSLPSDTANYTVSTAVTNTTAIVDPATGNPMLNSLGMATLLKLLNMLMGGKSGGPADASAGSLLDKIKNALGTSGGGASTVVPTTAGIQKLGLNTSIDTTSGVVSLDTTFNLTASPAAIAAGITVARTGDGQWQINFSGSLSNLPAEGTLISTYCEGTTKMGIYMPALDHRVIELNSADCQQTTIGTAFAVPLVHGVITDAPDSYPKNTAWTNQEPFYSYEKEFSVKISGPVIFNQVYSKVNGAWPGGTMYASQSTYPWWEKQIHSSSDFNRDGSKRFIPGTYTITFVTGDTKFQQEEPYANLGWVAGWNNSTQTQEPVADHTTYTTFTILPTLADFFTWDNPPA